MANKEHSALTDTDGLHEPKGALLLTGGASDNKKVYKSDGAGSGGWEAVTGSSEEAELSLGESPLNASTTTLAALDTYYFVAGTWVEEEADGMTTTVGTGRINVTTAGSYTVSTNLSVIPSRANKILHVSFMVNGTRTGPRTRISIGSATATAQVSILSDLPSLSAGDFIQVCIASITGDTPYTVGDTVLVENAIFHADLERAS